MSKTRVLSSVTHNNMHELDLKIKKFQDAMSRLQTSEIENSQLHASAQSLSSVRHQISSRGIVDRS